MATIVGLDPSLTGFGVAKLEDGDFLSTTVITSNKTGVQRLIEIRDRIRKVVLWADLVCIEDFAFSRANQAHNLGGLGWIIRVMMHELDVPFMIVGTGQVKKFATGKGNAKKPEIMLAVYKRWGKEFIDDNEADAFVLMKIAETLVDVLNGSRDVDEKLAHLPKFQQEVIQEIIKANSGNKGNKNSKNTAQNTSGKHQSTSTKPKSRTKKNGGVVIG